MTSLKKVVERASYGTVRESGKVRQIIIRIIPPNVVGFRAKGCRREYQLTMESCYLMAVRASVESERRKMKNEKMHHEGAKNTKENRY